MALTACFGGGKANLNGGSLSSEPPIILLPSETSNISPILDLGCSILRNPDVISDSTSSFQRGWEFRGDPCDKSNVVV